MAQDKATPRLLCFGSHPHCSSPCVRHGKVPCRNIRVSVGSLKENFPSSLFPPPFSLLHLHAQTTSPGIICSLPPELHLHPQIEQLIFRPGGKLIWSDHIHAAKIQERDIYPKTQNHRVLELAELEGTLEIILFQPLLVDLLSFFPTFFSL